MLFWAIDNPSPANYLLISGDRDFSNALHQLRMRRYNILLAHAPNVSQALVAAAKFVWIWSSLISGGSPINKETSQSGNVISSNSGINEKSKSVALEPRKFVNPSTDSSQPTQKLNGNGRLDNRPKVTYTIGNNPTSDKKLSKRAKPIIIKSQQLKMQISRPKRSRMKGRDEQPKENVKTKKNICCGKCKMYGHSSKECNKPKHTSEPRQIEKNKGGSSGKVNPDQTTNNKKGEPRIPEARNCEMYGHSSKECNKPKQTSEPRQIEKTKGGSSGKVNPDQTTNNKKGEPRIPEQGWMVTMEAKESTTRRRRRRKNKQDSQCVTTSLNPKNP